MAIGMCLAADLSRRLGWLDDQVVERIISLLERAKLPIIPPTGLGIEGFMQLMSVDKKNVDGEIRLILLKAIGEVTLPVAVADQVLRQTLEPYLG